MKKVINLIVITIFTIQLIGCGYVNIEETVIKDKHTFSIENIDNIMKQYIILEKKIKEPKKEIFTLSLLAVGDNLIHSPIYKKAKQKDGTYDFNPMYKNIKETVQSYDLSINSSKEYHHFYKWWVNLLK